MHNKGLRGGSTRELLGRGNLRKVMEGRVVDYVDFKGEPQTKDGLFLTVRFLKTICLNLNIPSYYLVLQVVLLANSMEGLKKVTS